MVKKMVRLALASEYSRLPIRRTDISAKVLGEQGSRQFKTVFDSAQRELRQVFGMEMTELPTREKVTVAQRRGKFVSHSNSQSSTLIPTNSYFFSTLSLVVLCCLPNHFSLVTSDADRVLE